MPQSLAQIYLHIVFSTKDRRLFLQDASIRDEMHNYLGGICNNVECPTLRVGGVADHTHSLFALSRTQAIARVVKEMKRTSSGWIKEASRKVSKFHWQGGYAAFSVSQSNLADVIRYIENQEEHHRRVTFQDEYRAFLNAYRIEFDERYIWD